MIPSFDEALPPAVINPASDRGLIKRVYEVFGGGGGGERRQSWLPPIVDGQPTLADLQAAAEAWARHDSEGLDNIAAAFLEAPDFLEPEEAEAAFEVTRVALLALHREREGLGDEPWERTAVTLWPQDVKPLS